MNFTLKVKNGDIRYQWDEKKGKYGDIMTDYLDEYDNLSAALVGFLEWVGDVDLDSKVSLSFTPEDVKKGKKGKK